MKGETEYHSTEEKEESLCSQYLSHYDAVHSWAFNSLDIVKGQLIPLCFPIFVHCYIDLLTKFPDEKDSHAQFWSNWHSDFNVNYTDELSSLCTFVSKDLLQSAEYLEAHPFMAKSIRFKFVIRLSGIAYSIFTSHIIQNELTVVASIINSKIKFIKESDHSPNLQQGGAYIEFEDPKLDNEQSSVSSSQPSKSVNDSISLVLGVPGTSGLATTSLHYPDTREDGIYRDLLSRLSRPSSILKQSAASINARLKKRTRPEGASSSMEADLDLLKQIGSRLTSVENSSSNSSNNAADAQEPSVIFATITNTYEGLVCMHVNDDVSQVATGYKDNIVRVWRLDNNSTNSSDNGEIKSRMSGRGSGSSNRPVGIRSLGESVAPNWSLNEVLPKPKDGYVGNHLSGSQDNHSAGSGMLELCGHSMPVFGVSQDHTSRLVLSSSGDESIRLWDVSVSSCVGRYTCVSPSWCVQFNPLGYYFAAGNQDKTVTMYSTDRTAPMRMLVGHTSDVNAVCWHGNGLMLGSGSDDKTARLWDVRQASCVRILKGSSAPLSCVSISPSGHLMAGGTEQGSIVVWDLTTGKEVAVLQGHVSGSGGVYSLNFSGDGSALISGGADCSVRVWDVSVLSAQDTKPGAVHSKLMVRPLSTFYTKFSPVYYVNYTKHNLAYAGGPYSMTAATRHQESQSNSLFSSSMQVSEQETVSALRISRAVNSHT